MSAFKLNNSMFMRPRNLPPSAWIGHIPFAGWITEELKPAVFVELGTHTGTSYLAFCQAIKQNAVPGKCFAVDTWEGDQHAGVYEEDIYECLRETHDEQYAGFSTLLRTTFDEALAKFEDASIDLLHIDGLHTYDAVRHDFETWLPKMSTRGVVLFHDTAERERDFGVWKLWAELASRYPAFEFQHSHGLGVLLVGAQVPEAVRCLAASDGSQPRLVCRIFETLASDFRLTPEFEIDGASMEQGESGLLLAYLRQQLVSAQAQLAQTHMQLGRADAYSKTQSSHAESLMGQIADRESRIERVNGQLLECRAELARASQHLLAADQNARAHVAASALVQRDIQDLQRLIAEKHTALIASEAELASVRSELVETRQQLDKCVKQ